MTERKEYLLDVLGLKLIPTTEYIKPYNSAKNVTPEKDAALLEEIADIHGQKPDLITTTTAESVYESKGIDELYRESEHYGNIHGSNKFKKTRVAAVIGSNHYGDRFIKKWAAYADRTVESPDRSNPQNRGVNLSYGHFGDQIYRHMCHHDTLQAAMRFGRDGDGAVVYVHTNTLPGWVPVAAIGAVVQDQDVVNTHSGSLRQVIGVIREREQWSTADVAEHPDVGVGARQVRRLLDELVDLGVVEKHKIGGANVWKNRGVAEINEFGTVELGDGPDISRFVSNYTWNVRTQADVTLERRENGDEDVDDPAQGRLTGD